MPTRPFHFMLTFWGPRHTDYLTDRLLPSLLAPWNLPQLRAEDGHKLMLATTRQDWDRAKTKSSFQLANAYVTPTLVEVSLPPDNSYHAVVLAQTRNFKLLFEAAYQAKAFGCLLSPDCLVSDNLVRGLMGHRDRGCKLVLLTATRQTEEAVLAEIGTEQWFTPRRLAGLMLRYMHPDVQGLEEGHPSQTRLTPFRFWRVPGHQGAVFHSFFSLPVLMDFTAVQADHIDCLDSCDYENVYLGRNFGPIARSGLQIITDSDECCVLSLTPSADRRAPAEPTPRCWAWWPRLAQLANIRENVGFYITQPQDEVRRQLFQASVVLHSDDLDQAYATQRARVQRLIMAAAGDSFGARWWPGYWVLQFISWSCTDRTQLLWQAITGNRTAWARLIAKLRRVITGAKP